MGLVWKVWCTACLCWGHMVAQGFYRLAGAPPYSYPSQSSSYSKPFLGSGKHYVLTLFQSDLEHLEMGTRGGVHECLNHVCHTQARHYIVALIGPHNHVTQATCWVIQNNDQMCTGKGSNSMWPLLALDGLELPEYTWLIDLSSLHYPIAPCDTSTWIQEDELSWWTSRGFHFHHLMQKCTANVHCKTNVDKYHWAEKR